MEPVLNEFPLPFNRINDFLLLSVIQEGVFSISVIGYQENLKRPVFLKILKPAIKNQPEWMERFTREAQICAQLKNIHVVDIYLIGEFQSYTFMAMEYVHGLSLKNLLSYEKPLNQHVAFSIFRQILTAVDYVHKNGIIHRDIKPGNILVDIYGQVRLTDFGLAYLGQDASITQTGTILGTPAYMSPEQILGKNILPQSDFFSLGATLYEMLTGVKAFAGESYSICIQKILNENPPAPSTFLKTLHPEIDEFIFWLLEKNPASRPASVTDIIKRFDNLPFKTDDKLNQSDIGNLIKKYYQPPSVLPESTKREIVQNFSSEKITSKYNFLRRWLTLSFFIILSLIIIILLQQKHDQSLERLPGVPDSIDSAAIEMSSDRTLNDNQFAPERISAENNLIGKDERIETDPMLTSSFQKGKMNVLAKNEIPTLPENSNRIMNLPMEKNEITGFKKSILIIETYPWSTVYIDGVMTDSITVKKEYSLEPGKHQLVFTHPEYPPKVSDINIAEAETLIVSFSFLENSGFLYVEARPWAEIYLDGKYRDTTPLQNALIVSAGDHVLELRHPSFNPIREMITIQANDTIYIRKKFIK